MIILGGLDLTIRLKTNCSAQAWPRSRVTRLSVTPSSVKKTADFYQIWRAVLNARDRGIYAGYVLSYVA